MKTLEEFDFAQAPQIPAAKIRELAEGGYIERAEPVVLIGECGTGKTHLATGLCVAACRQKRRVRFTTAANLVNELVEAQQHNGVRRVLARWMRYDLIALDEVGYVPLAEIGAEFLFQVIAERAERATLIVTTNLPFSEWTQVFPNPRLCKALLDRITDRAHIIETGTESYRFRRTMEVRQEKESFVITGQRKGLRRRPFPCTPSRLRTGKLNYAPKGGPNESITGGPNQVVKRTWTIPHSFAHADFGFCDTPRLASNRLGILIPTANSFLFLCGPGMSVPLTRTQGSFGSAPQAGHLNAKGSFMRSILRPGRKDAI